MERQATLAIFLVYTLLVAGTAVLADRHLFGRAEVVKEQPAPEERHADGGLTLEKRTDPAGAPPVGDVPAGHRPVRAVTATVQPAAPPAPTAATPPECREAAATMTCPPVTTDIVVSQADNGTLRITANSKDGTVTGGTDYVLGDLVVRDDRRWAAGLSVPTADHESVGLVLQWDAARWLRVGADIYRVDPGFDGVPPVPAVAPIPGLFPGYPGHPGVPGIEPFITARIHAVVPF